MPFCSVDNAIAGFCPNSTRIARANGFRISISMMARNKHIPKSTKRRGPGRPPKPDAANQVVPVQLSKDLIAKLDAWSEGEGVKFRSAAIRRLLEEALSRKRL
jgi:hypothetical protein